MAQSLKARAPFAARSPQLLEITDLSGGLDLRRSPTLVSQTRARALRNFSLGEPGALKVRAGYMAYSSNSLGGDRIQGGQRVYLGSTQLTLVAYGGAVHAVDDVTQRIDSTAVYSTISPTNEVFFPYDRTLVCVMDGSNRPRKSTNGIAWSLMGIDASTGQCTCSSLSSGSLSASEFEFTFAYKDRGLAHESNISTVVSTRTLGATGAMHVEIPNSTDSQTDAIVVYARNKTAGELVLRKASSFAAQGGASSTHRITSSGWSANNEAPTNHNAPTPYDFGVTWKNRMWAKDATVGNRLHFTELFQPQSWPTLFYIDIPFERGDEITALTPQGDTLIVWGQSKPYLIIGQTSLDFEVRPSAGAQSGAVGPRATDIIEQGVLHQSAEGLHVFDGATDKLLTFDIEPAIRDVVQNAASTSLTNVALVYEFKYKELRCAVPRVYPRGTRGELVLDLNRTRETETPAWTDTDRDIAGYIHFNGDEPTAGNRGRLLSWPSSGGRLFEESTGTTANSSNMTATYEGPHISLGLHRARLIRVNGEYEPHGGALTIEPVLDEVSQGSQGVTIGAGIAQYGSGVYGTATYGGAGRKMFTNYQPLGAEGRTAWINATYSGQESFKLFTYSMEIIPETGVRGFSD